MIERYIEAPTRIEFPPNANIIFLAGGITGIANWQDRACEVLHNVPNLFICNPRRKNFEEFKNTAGYSASEVQIRWEFDHLALATQILFWFGKETVQPIALFELGTKIRGNVPLFIGAHPEYPRRFDMVVQSKLYGYQEEIIDDLDKLLRVVINYNKLAAICKKR